MAAPATTADLLELIRQSALIEPGPLDLFLQGLTPEEHSSPPRHLTNLLIDAGLLTRFQAEQLLLGKWRGFTLGKYKVLERLGVGGMGAVYLCEHLVMRHRVAIKVLPTNRADNPVALGRFYREARAAGLLDHPNLVKAHDIDRDGPLHFLVMEYVDGPSLQDLVARNGPLPIERAAHYIRQAAQGLQHAHQVGLVHRDIKPGNILLDRTGTIRVLDLGLARFFEDNEDLLTLKYDENNVLGTADYVAPEQALNSHEVDIRADIYSLGGTFYFLLTGQPPFPEGRVAHKLVWHQVRQPTPVQQVRPEVPPALAALVARMMAKEPAQRYQTPAEVVEALTPWTPTPLATPAVVEMPSLCPAIRSSSSPGVNQGPRTPPPLRQTASRRARTVPPPATLPPRQDAGPHHAPLSPRANLDTPRALASHLTMTKTVPAPTNSSPPGPEAAPPVSPSAHPKRSPAPTKAALRSGWLRLVAILLGGATGGVLLRWLLGY